VSTLGTLRARLANEIGRYDLLEHFDDAIRSAIEFHEAERFAFNEARFRLDTVAAQEFYTLPTALLTPAGAALATGEDLIEIDNAVVRNNNTGSPMRAVDPDELEILNSTTTTGQPTAFARVGDQLRLGPIPDAVYSIYIHGTKKLSTLTASSDTNAWMVAGEALTRATAVRLLARDVLRDTELMSAAAIAERDALIALRRKSTDVLPRRIRPWGY